MKIPLQDKIADLESRIMKLEAAEAKRRKVVTETVTQTSTFTINDYEWTKDWEDMWNGFHNMIDRVFSRRSHADTKTH
jgi:hypothetical protein